MFLAHKKRIRLPRGVLYEQAGYDEKHGTDYIRTLELYLKNNGSIQAVAEAMFTHRNTVTYRMRNIRQMLGSPLETAEEKLPYQIACLILHMASPAQDF